MKCVVFFILIGLLEATFLVECQPNLVGVYNVVGTLKYGPVDDDSTQVDSYSLPDFKWCKRRIIGSLKTIKM